MVEVQELGAGIGAAYEEVAVLYANGSAREAESLLDAVLASEIQGAGEGLWMMLLDLYKLTGQRERFESKVLDYATRFERSPPPWVDLSSARVMPRKSDAAPLVNLAGELTGQAAPQLKQMETIGIKSGAIRIDLKRLRSVDESGCMQLIEMLRKLGAERVKVSLLNGGQLISMLAGQIHTGRAEGRHGWLLMLELLQHSGEHARFEDLAVDYAITFEESPPSWDPRLPTESAVAAATEEDAHSDDKVVLEGELTSSNNESIRKLAAFAADKQVIEVDCSQLRRLDFVSAGTLFNIVASLQSQGKLVCLQNVNAMVAALLRVMGVEQVAQVTLRP
ncbi:MAG: STAS domain-containing protein [Rhodocyclales bacterium]|nr:STAS domain-containing protein [Rhodocyclales bacterium]